MRPSAFTAEQDLALLRLVKDSPVLYNNKHADYGNGDAKVEAWKSISETLGKPPAEFAGIQCQIHFGDFQEDKHKPGFLENLSEYLPEQYSSSWGMEKKILKEYRKHQGVSQLDAKYLYTKTARAMPTYGVTFFLVKEKQKDKKKLVPRLLGINAESILRLDERTKEILQVWPLTHVKTYHAGKGETFTLNFGDYSDKEYSVKTRDAYRIRDILESYIDIIRRRMLAAYNAGGGDTGVIGEENMSASSANMMQHVSHNPSQQIEHCIVGPTRIVPHEPGQQASTGTQIVTVQEIITTHRTDNKQTAVTGDVPMRSDMSMPFTRRLNRLNSNAVKVVSYLTEHGDVDQARRQVLAMLEDMPVVRNGVRETIDKQTTDDARRKLEEQLHELEELMKMLDQCTLPDKLDKDEAVDAAKNIADVTTQMYFSMDPKTKRRSQLLRNSRPSFIEDERTENNLRRASFIAATATAINTLDQSIDALQEKYTGPKLAGDQVPATEKSAVDNLAKLNAAIAHYLMAHSDPKNVDYGAAVTSMNTIHEFMPELVNDVKALASIKDEQTRKKMLADLKALCEATGKVCATVGSEDPQKIQEASKAYSDVSGKLIFAFGRGSPADRMKKDKVVDLAKDVQSQAENLVKTTSPLAKYNTAVQSAGDGLNVAATRLVDQAELTGSTLHEPHCQSALTAAAEAVSSSAQHLSAQCRPLLEDQHQLADALHHRAMALAQALDALKANYVNDELDHQNLSPGEIQRLKFIKSASGAKKQLEEAEKQLNTALPSAVNTSEVESAQGRLEDRLAQLNAAMASLIAATADRENPDYATADLAINTISELMPGIVHDSKITNFNKDAASRADMMEHIKALCEATSALCHPDVYDTKGSIGDAVDKFKDASGKLVYVVGRRVNPEKEQEIVQLAAEACGGTSELLCGVQQLSEDVGGEVGEQLDAHGAQLADSAQQLLALAQVTAPTISDPRCQSVLLAAADKVADSSRQLTDCWTPLSKDKRHEQRLHQLQQAQAQLQQQLDKLKAACHSAGDDVAPAKHSSQQHKLKFMKSNVGAQQQMKKALEDLNKPLAPAKPGSAPVSPQQLSQRLDALNAALAQLMQATRDPENPDYETAEQQIKIIAELMPQIVHDTKSTSASKDAASRAAMLDQIRALCEATESLCQNSDGTHPQELNDAVSKLSASSGKLVFTLTPARDQNKGQQVVELSAGACAMTSELLCGVQQLSEDVGGEVGEQLDAHGAQLADSAQQLLALAQVTAPSISDPRCQSVLLAAADKVADSSRQLTDCWTPLSKDKRHEQRLHQLQQAQAQLQQQLDKLRAACHSAGDEIAPTKHSSQEDKLKFMNSKTGTQHQLKKALEDLNKPLAPPKPGSAPVSPQQLSQRLDALTAALAQLMQATRDADNPDYKTAEQQAQIISELMPQIVHDAKSASATKDPKSRAAMLEQLRALCEATNGLCQYSDGTHPQELNEAVSKFSASSGKLVFTLTPARDQDKGQQVVELSAGACATTSELLCGVQQLSEDVGGEVGEQLDAHGAQLADSAQQLLTLAQVTAPSISDPRCQSVLLAAADKVADSSRQLTDCWTPLSKDKRHEQRLHQLQQAQSQLQQQLDKLKAACHSAGDDVAPAKHSSQEHKLKFMKSNAGAQQQINKTLDDLHKPLAPPKPGSAPVSPQQLSQRLDALTAALAQLMQATRDAGNPDYETAEQQVKIISELMPQIVQDTKSASASQDAESRTAMMEQIRAVCEATSALCQYSDGTHPQELNEAVSKFSASSGKLMFTLTPARDQDKGQQVVELSAGACATTSELLCGVQQLSENVGGEVGEQLDAHGAQLADSAQQLLALAQVTAPSISDPRCQSVLLAAADKVADSSRQLTDCWTPLSKDKRNELRLHQLQKAQAHLQQQLDKLRAACHSASDDVTPTKHSSQEQRLMFMKSNAGAQQQMKKALDDINKPLAPPKPGSAPVSPQQLSQRLDALNAALAQLMQATRDAENPDYETAERQVKIISELMPQIVQDTKVASASKDAASRAAMLEEIRALCEATNALCQYTDGTHPQELNEAVSKFSASSGKLVFTLTPARDQDKGQQVVELSAGACATTSELLCGVQQLSEDVGGEVGEQLDAHGAQLADSAQQLLALAQVTAPSISDPRCQSVLLAAADKVADSSRQLADCWTPLSMDKWNELRLHQLQKAQAQLQQQLDKLRAACHSASDDVGPTKHSSQEHKLKFMKSNTGAQQQMKKTLDDLSKPLAPPKPGSAPVSPQQLLQRLDSLNAALAQLMQATRDAENPDYETAERQVKIISELMPQIVQDTKSASASKDAASRAAMLDEIRALCEATSALYQYTDGTHPQELNEAVSKFSASSGKLMFTLTPARDQDKGQQVVELSAGACATTSELLCGVQQLSEDVGGEVGEQLDAHGAQLADSAQQLLALAQVTAPSISDPRCQSVLLAAADKVADSSRHLTDCWTPLSKDKRNELRLHQLQKAQAQLQQQLDKLRAACHSASDDVGPTKHSSQEQRLMFMKSNAGAQQQMKKALDDINKPLAPPKPGSAPVSPQQLSQRLDALNAALALLMQATRDAENPDYETAERQVKIISELMPQIVQDTKSASASKDAGSRAAMLDEIRALCEATNALCQYTDGTHPQELNEAVSKFSASSGKLVFTLTPARDQDKGQQVVELSAGACATTSELLCGVQQLSEDVGGEVGEQLDAHGAQLADSAQQLLALAQVTAPSISDPRCQSVLLAAADKVSDSSRQLTDCWTPLSKDKRNELRLHQLQKAQAQLQQQLDKLRAACHSACDDVAPTKHSSQEHRLKFMKTNTGAQQQMKKALDDLSKPLAPPKPGSAPVSPQQLSQRLDALTAALAQLMHATRNSENPDYETAEQQVKIISELMPQIVQDTKSASASKDAASRAAMLDQMRALCEATNALCQYTDGTHPQELSEAVSKFSASSGKLAFTLTPTRDQDNGQQVVKLSAESCATTSELLCGVQQLSEDVGGEVGEQLDAHGAQLADSAQQLLALAQVTAPSISDPRCQSVLLAAADKVADSSRQLTDCWTPLLKDERHKNRLHQLQQAQARLQQQLDKLRNACHLANEDASSVDIRPSGKLGKPRPAVPKRASSIMKPSETDFNKQFLETLRCEESRAADEYEKKLKLDQEKVQREQFVATVDDVHQNLLTTEQDLKKWCESPNTTAVSGGERTRMQKEMQQAIAQAGVDVAQLVAANYADKIDYPSASKSTAKLPKLVTEIVKDGKVLSGVMKDSARQEFLNDMLQLCESTRNICDAAKNDRQKLNQSAMVFGDNSAKLLYAVSDDVDPAVEKEIISRAKAIGDSASRLALEATNVGGATEAGDSIITAGTNCVDAAGKLVYTAKLVAPSIHEFPCQEALVTSASSLSLALDQFSVSWRPLARFDTTEHLYKEADNLNRILDGLMSDIKGGNIGKRREMEKLVIEDTPIRMLTLDIIEGAKQLSSSAEVAPAMQKQYEQYWSRVSTALQDVDIAHARCNNTPHDAVKRSELENAVQHLQMTLLTSRPNAGNQNSNIVDLRDFIEEVSSEAQKLADATDSVKVDAYDKKALQDIKENCVKMSTEAYKLTHPDGETGYDTTFNDILDIDTFGQDCDDVIKEINTSLRGIQDDRVKKQLLVKMLPLTETCNMMRFATKSGMSASKCASLESTLSDLDDIEDRVIPSLVKQKEDQGHVALRVPADAGSGRTSQVTSLLSAARDVTVTSPRGPLTAYVATCAATVSDEEDRNKLLEHLYKVVRLWKLQTLSASKRLAVWQQLTHPELAQVTGQLIQEIQSPESEFSASSTQSPQHKVLDDKDVNRLLLPGEAKVLFNPKKQSEQLAHMSTKLGSISSTIQSSIASPQSLARSSKETVNTACELAALARGCKNTRDPLKSEQIEESVQRMTFATYNLLKVAEKSTTDPNNPNVRRRLQDACRNLNDTISKLVLTSSSAAPLHRSCTALALSLQASPPGPGAPRPPPASYQPTDSSDDDVSASVSDAHTMSYQSATDALYEQQNVLNKMNNDQLQCRLEFAKTLSDVTGAVRKSSEYAVQCAYLISISESDKETAKKGVVNVPRIERSISHLQDSCIRIIGSTDIDGAKEESTELKDRLTEFSLCMEQASNVCLPDARTVVERVKGNVGNQGEGVRRALATGDMDKVLSETVQLLDVLNYAYCTVDKCPLLPTAENMSQETKDRCDEVVNHSKTLVDRTLVLVKEVESREQTETMTWTTFSTSRKKLLDAYDNLLKTIKVNGQRAGILEAPVEEEKDESDVQQKTYLETQVDIANRWLTRPMCKENIKTAGHQAVSNIIDIGRKMSEELSGSDREEMRSLVMETEELQLQCSTTRDVDKYRALSESVKEMKKLVQRGVVTRVVEDLVDVGTPLEDLDILTDTEPDATKRKYILERKIAELLSQLGKVTRTARIVGLNQPDNEQLNECTKQAELLAPKLVQAAEKRVNNPNDEEAIEKYKALVLEYAESIARLREMCDKSVDPMDFVQTAGDMMQRLRAESTSNADPQKSAQASQSIIRLANRTIEVSLSSAGSKSDPELQAALVQARARLHAVAPAGARASRIHDIHASTDEIIRTTNEVESALGGENIFNKQPTEFNEKIFSVAMDLRESVREWSSRDNEVVGAARRMAVLMAHLSEHMHTDNKRALILTSKKIVLESQEVAELAKKLAHECSDVRIKNNLLQTCERIPTISHQLKMLTTVKSSALGHQGTEEDKAAMDMLVGNAQSLMLSVQEVVKAAASASVKIMSQRGPRLKWVRKTCY